MVEPEDRSDEDRDVCVLFEQLFEADHVERLQREQRELERGREGFEVEVVRAVSELEVVLEDGLRLEVRGLDLFDERLRELDGVLVSSDYCGHEVYVLGVFLEHLFGDHEQVLEQDVRAREARQLAQDVEQSADVLAVARTDRAIRSHSR